MTSNTHIAGNTLIQCPQAVFCVHGRETNIAWGQQSLRESGTYRCNSVPPLVGADTLAAQGVAPSGGRGRQPGSRPAWRPLGQDRCSSGCRSCPTWRPTHVYSHLRHDYLRLNCTQG